MRLKDEAGLAEWRLREWQELGQSPVIVGVTDAIRRLHADHRFVVGMHDLQEHRRRAGQTPEERYGASASGKGRDVLDAMRIGLVVDEGGPDLVSAWQDEIDAIGKVVAVVRGGWREHAP